jgi:hypothetical protein
LLFPGWQDDRLRRLHRTEDTRADQGDKTYCDVYVYARENGKLLRCVPFSPMGCSTHRTGVSRRDLARVVRVDDDRFRRRRIFATKDYA